MLVERGAALTAPLPCGEQPGGRGECPGIKI